MKHRLSRATEINSYHFLAFKRRIDAVPPSQIRETAEDYLKLIQEDISQEAVEPDVEVQCILNFLDFLGSNIVPQGLSKREKGFYLRTIERMVSDGFLHRVVLEEFNRTYSLQDSPRQVAIVALR